MKKGIVIGIILIAIVMIAYFVFTPNQQTNERGAIKIGVILPLTGDAALFGKPMQNAINLFFSNYNNTTSFSLIFEDDKANPTNTINAYYKLKQGGCNIFIGTITSASTLALAPIIEKENSLLISPSSSSPKISDAGDNTFRVELSDEYGATKQAQLLAEELHINDISIIYINNDYGVGVVNTFKKLSIVII